MYLTQIKQLRLSQLFYWLFLVSLPFNLRVIYSPENAYVSGYFSYYLGYFLYLSDLILIACFTGFLIENLSKLRNIRWNIDCLLPLLFLILALAGWFHVKQVDFRPFYWGFKIAELLGVVWYTARQTNLKTPLAILFWSGVFQAIVGIWQFHVQHGVGLRILGEYVSNLGTGGLAMIDSAAGKVLRAYGTFPHPNIMGGFLVVCLVIGYYLVSRETRVNRRFWPEIGSILMLLGIFVSFSRVAWLLAAVATMAFAVYNYVSKNPKRSATIVFIAIVSCATILAFWHPLVLNRISTESGSASSVGRGALNSAGWEIFQKFPVFGTGTGNYVPQMIEMFHVKPWEYQPAHNLWIYLLASWGIAGLGLFLWLLYRSLGFMWNAKFSDLKFALLFIGAALFLMSNFDHFLVTIQQGQLLFAVCIGLIAAYKNYVE